MARQNKETEFVEITVYVHAVSMKAALVSTSGNESEAAWIPKSQMRFDKLERNTETTLEIADWIGEREGLL